MRLLARSVTAVGPRMSKECEVSESAVPNFRDEVAMNTPTLAIGTAVVALAAGITSAGAQDLQASSTTVSLSARPTPVVVIVRVPKPWYAPRAVVIGKMRDTIPEYAKLPGLMFKAFSFERDSSDFGGLYFWRDRASAEAWFNPAWFERVRKERGVEAQVRMFDALASVDNTAGGTLADSESRAVGTLVEIPIPAGVTRERLAAEFNSAVPTYQRVPGLLRKHFTVSSNGSFGGVYLWKDEASARAWFSEAWHSRVVKTYGQDAKIEWFDTPILLPSQDAANLSVARALLEVAP
jgi:heme-degrading monooxygenase HmoA